MGKITAAVDRRGEGLRFDGVGGVSSAGTSKLMIDYPEKQKSDIFDMIFKPKWGASLQELRIQIGGDYNSSSSAEGSHARTLEEYSDLILHVNDPNYIPNIERFNRSYQFYITDQALMRNKSLRLSCLPLEFPAWVGEGQMPNRKWVDYLISYLKGALVYKGYSFEYISPRNEMCNFPEWPGELIAEFKREIEKFNKEYGQHVLLAGNEQCGMEEPWHHPNRWSQVKEMLDGPLFLNAYDAVAQHYPNWTSTPEAKEILREYGKPLWDTEDQGSYQFYDTQHPYRHKTDWERALHYGRIINRNYPNASITKTLFVNLFGSYYEPNYCGCWNMTANQPWSGWYDFCPDNWVLAHTAQFSEVGWHYIDGACGLLYNCGDTKIAGSYVTLMDKGTGDFSIIAETADMKSPVAVRFETSVNTPLSVWRTDQYDYFTKIETVNIIGGGFEYTFEPGKIYSLTTLSGEKSPRKGGPKHEIPKPAAFPSPFYDDFNMAEYKPGQIPKYFMNVNGAFEITEGGYNGAKYCLKQMITQRSENNYRPNPVACTVLGEYWWKDYEMGVRVRIGEETPEGFACLMGKLYPLGNGWFDVPENAYLFKLSKFSNGGNKWELIKTAVNNLDAPALLSGVIGGLDWNEWAQLKIKFTGNAIDVYINGLRVGNYVDGNEPYSAGTCGLACSYDKICFADFTVKCNDPDYDYRSFASRADVSPHIYRNDLSGKIGMKICMAKNVIVKELGRWYMQGNKKTHELFIYDADALELLCGPIVVDMDKGAAKMDCFKGFVYAPLKIPVKLEAGKSYYIVSKETDGGDAWHGSSALPKISVDSGVGEILCGVILDKDRRDFYGSAGNCFGPVNFRYNNALV